VGGARHARRPKCRRLPEAPASWLTRRWSATPSTRPSWRRQVSANAMGYTVCPYRSRPCSGISQRTDGRQDACSTSALGVAPGVEVIEQPTVPWGRSKVISFSRPYGTGFPWASFAPAMNCWAILTCPCRGGSAGGAAPVFCAVSLGLHLADGTTLDRPTLIRCRAARFFSRFFCHHFFCHDPARTYHVHVLAMLAHLSIVKR